MREISLVILGLLLLIGAMLFGSIGLCKLVHLLGWPNDALAFATAIFLFLAGLTLSAWQASDLFYKIKQ